MSNANDSSVQDTSDDSSGDTSQATIDALIAALQQSQPVKQPTPKAAPSPFQAAQQQPIQQPAQSQAPQPQQQRSPYQAAGSPSVDPNANAGGGQYSMAPVNQTQMAQNNASRPAFFASMGQQLNQQDQQQQQQQGSKDPRLALLNQWMLAYHQANPNVPQQEIMKMAGEGLKDGLFGPDPVKSNAGKTVDEQVYAATIAAGGSPQAAAAAAQASRGIGAAAAGAKAESVEEGKKNADTLINKPKAEMKLADLSDGLSNAIKFIGMAKKQVSGMTTGAGSLLSGIPGTAAKDLAATVATVKANIGFDKLQMMKDESPNGSALGRVTNMEIGLLQNVVANLDTEQSQEQFNLHLDIAEDELKKAKKRIADAYDLTYGTGGAEAAEEALGGAESSGSTATPNSVNWSDLP